MASALLIFVTVVLFTTLVATFLSLAASAPWRLVRDLLLIVGVIAGLYPLGVAAAIAPEWRNAFVGGVIAFFVASLLLRISAYRPSRRDPDRARAVLWRRGALIALPIACGLWIGLALFVDWRLRADIEEGIAEARKEIEATPAGRDATEVYESVAARLRDDEETPEAAAAILADTSGFMEWSAVGGSVLLDTSPLSDLESLELDEAQRLLDDVARLFRREEKLLGTLREAARDPNGHLGRTAASPYWERAGGEARPRAVWACGMVLYHHARQAEREGDADGALASARALEGLTDQLLRTARLGIVEFSRTCHSGWLNLEPLLASSAFSPDALDGWSGYVQPSRVEQLPRVLGVEELRLLEFLRDLEPSGVTERFLRLVRLPSVVDGWRSTHRRIREGAKLSYPDAVTRKAPETSRSMRARSSLHTLGFDSATELRSVFEPSGSGWVLWTPDSLFAHLPFTVDLLCWSAARADARCRLQRVGIALYRYHLREGRFPDALDELVPGYLSDVPSDPYDGKSLRFRREESECAVYSVGPDGEDDGGTVDAGPVLLAEGSRGKDFVFRCSSASLASSGNEPTGQIATATSIVDHDYRFRLDSPGFDWRLMGEDAIRRITPDALAGASSRGVFGAVHVSAAPFPELKACVKTLIDAMRGEEGEVPVLEDLQYQGRPAVRFSIATRTQGVAVRIEPSGSGWVLWTPDSLFAHLPFTVDLLCWSAARADARCRLQRVGIALYRYHLREGRFPDALDELVPG